MTKEISFQKIPARGDAEEEIFFVLLLFDSLVLLLFPEWNCPTLGKSNLPLE